MRASMFNLQVPLPETGEVFLLNTLTDAQLLVSPDVAALLAGLDHRAEPLSDTERAAVEALGEHGFVVETRDGERRALDGYMQAIRDDREQLRVTVLTTLQCNFACEYCFQGDRGDQARFAQRMSVETAARVTAWIERRLDEVSPGKLVIIFFGGEPLLNLPVLYDLAERAHDAARTRGIAFGCQIITNGLLLAPEIVDRLLPLGLELVKVTLDGDRDTHDNLRPLRGGQGTFDRIIANVRRVVDKVPVAIGGNFDASSADRFPALLDFLGAQGFADKLARVWFKPIIGATANASALTRRAPASADDTSVGGGCSNSVTSGGGCTSCGIVDEKLAMLRNETRRRGFSTPDGVHMGPCEIHRRHAWTIGPDGALYACGGFSGDPTQAIGHIDDPADALPRAAAREFERLAPWKSCDDCSFIPVCGGGCTMAARTELGDMHAPSCHKASFEAALVSLAHSAAEALREVES